MDSRDNFLKKIGSFLLTIDEEYLIGVSNKGIFNRAKKDLEKIENIKVEIEDETLKCTLDDGTTCFINEDIKAYKCSCPSRNICKHVVMCYLYLKINFNNLFTVNTEVVEDSSEDKEAIFKSLLNIDLETLSKLSGEKNFKDIINRINFGIDTKIQEGSILTIKFQDEDYTVKIIPKMNEKVSTKEFLEEIICSCRSKEICRHKVEAVIHYQLYKGMIKKQDLNVLNKNLEKKLYIETAILVKKLMEEILFVGVSRLPETILDKIESTALLCHNSNIPNIEKMLRSVKSELQLYMKKNASFSIGNLRKRLSSIYITALSIENSKDENKLYKLCGEHKSNYYDIPKVTLYGIGAEAWTSKSGYEGITYYFFEEGRQKLFTYTNSRPTYYDNKKRNYGIAYSEVPSWASKSNLEELSKHSIELYKGKINKEYRISSSEESEAQLLEKTDIYKLNFESVFINDWQQLLNKYSIWSINDLVIKKNKYIIKPENYEKSFFDSIKQNFIMPLYDFEKRKIYVVIEYSKDKKRMIQKFERMERLKKYPDSMLVDIYISEGKLIVAPITAYYKDGTIINLTLE